MLNLALLLWVASSPPVVELPPRASVFADGQDGPGSAIAGKVEVGLMQALKKKGIDLADLDALFPPTPAESGAEGEALFAKGREAYDNLDFDASIKSLADAAVFFIKHPTAAKADQLGEIFLFLGASELQNGAKADAHKDFTRALQMNPALAPDKKYFASDVLGGVAAAQKELDSKPKGKLSIDSTPSGAEVQALGRSFGLTPVADVELAPGRYLVSFKRPGYSPASAFPDVGEKTELKQNLETSPLYTLTRSKAAKLIGRLPFASDKQPPTVMEIGKAMSSRFLVLVAVTGDEKTGTGELQVWNVNSGDRLKGVKFNLNAEAGGLDTPAEAVHAWITRPSAVATEDEVQPSDGTPVFKQWWFWTAAGVVVAAGVTGAVVAAQPKGPQGFNTALGQP